jgi:two-component system response regulator PilR (NtrC family)
MVRTPHVLVVEPDRELLDVLARSLVRFGCRVTSVYAIHEALEQMASGTFDAAVVDHALPDVDGVALAQRLRQRHRDLPVVLLSSYADEVLLDEARGVGVFEVLSKPFRMVRLEDAVERAIEQARHPVPTVAAANFAWQ